jgi:hypothetical protein
LLTVEGLGVKARGGLAILVGGNFAMDVATGRLSKSQGSSGDRHPKQATTDDASR